MTHKNIFTFGSNLRGAHGKGSALEAKNKWGAKTGVGIGIQGSSYAIPTKDENLKVLPIEEIKKYVDEFTKFAEANPDMKFSVVKIGTGLAGYSNEEMAPLFTEARKLQNVNLDPEWNEIIFVNHLENASKIVSGWPDWKQKAAKNFFTKPYNND